MRAKLINGSIFVEDPQDSALLRVLANADALAVRPKDGKPLKVGSNIEYILL
jgi:molybdopterin biosynthesis enzyme